MNRTSAYALAAIVRTQRQRIGAAGDARILPIEFVRPCFVADPIALGIPEGTGFETEDVKTGTRQPLQKNAARRSDANNNVVDLVSLVEFPHRRVQVLQRAQHVLAVTRRLERSENWLFAVHQDLCWSASVWWWAADSTSADTAASGASHA